MATALPENATLGWQELALTGQTPDITYMWVHRIIDDEIAEIGLPTDGRGGPATTWRDSCGASEPLADPTNRQRVLMTSNITEMPGAASNERYDKSEEERREVISNGEEW